MARIAGVDPLERAVVEPVEKLVEIGDVGRAGEEGERENHGQDNRVCLFKKAAFPAEKCENRQRDGRDGDGETDCGDIETDTHYERLDCL